jgi:hypothetical protein
MVLCLTSILPDLYEKIQVQSRIAQFIKRFNVLRLMKESGFKKAKGVSLVSIIKFLVSLVFTHKNLFRTMQPGNDPMPFAKDTTYRFLNDPRSDWRLLQLKLGAGIIKQDLNSLTSEKRVRALVIDDSSYYRDRSKKVELLARVKDHVTGRYFKGFRKLTAGWTDGATFIPLAFSLLSSTKAENRLYEQGPRVPKGSPGELRRKEAVQSGTSLLLDLLDQILEHVQEFQYVLFDSWFSWPDVIKGVKERQRDVICMLKDMPKISYTYQGQTFRLSELYKVAAKQCQKKSYIASVVVDYYEVPVRIVFVRNRNSSHKREWLALLSTNLEVTEEEIIRIYGLRWDIEVYFKMCKSFLRLAKEFQSRTYDTMFAHTAIVSIRYMILAIENREGKDSRANGELFYLFCDEVADLDFTQAFLYILDLFTKTLRENLFLSDAMVNQILSSFMDKLPSFIKNRLRLNAT